MTARVPDPIRKAVGDYLTVLSAYGRMWWLAHGDDLQDAMANDWQQDVLAVCARIDAMSMDGVPTAQDLERWFEI